MAEFPDIKGYSIKKRLGEGGMASVFLGLDKKLNRLVAIKIFVPNVFGEQRNAHRFLKEGRTLLKLNHPNIVSVYDVGCEEDFYFIVMEYLSSDLKEKIRRLGHLHAHDALHIIRQISDALFYINRKGMIHRDIKPENIMFRQDDTPILVDFGIAKLADSTTKLTKTGMSIGTPFYMSPEQCSGKTVDIRTDIYALGVVLFEMLTGRVPYSAKENKQIFVKHISDPVPDLPLGLGKYQFLLERMMAKNRKDRLRSQDELVQIIKQLLDEPLERGTTKIKMSRRKAAKAVAEKQKTVEKPRTQTISRIEGKRHKSKRRKKFSFLFSLAKFIFFVLVILLSIKILFNISWGEMKDFFLSTLSKLLAFFSPSASNK